MAQALQRPAPNMPSSNRVVTLCVLAGALALLAILARPVITGRVGVYWDLGGFHLPIRDAYARALKAGDNFDWFTGMHDGVFITGEGEHGPYHPLHLALYRFLPLETAFALETCLHYPFLLLGMFVFLRHHAGTAGALFAGLAFIFSANCIGHGFHINYGGVLSHLPWLLWLEEKAVRQTGAARLRAVGGIAILTGSQLLLGHPQVLSFSLLAEALYAGFLLWGTATPWRGLAALATGKLLGAVVGGAQVLATLTFLAGSNRSSFDPYYASVPPAHLLQLLVPGFMVNLAPGWKDEPMYVGAVPLLLAGWWAVGLFRRRAGGPSGDAAEGLTQRLGWYALALGVLAAWLATGKHGGLYRLQTHLPIVGQFRAPCRYLVLVDFAVSILAGLALGRILAGVRDPRPWRGLAAPWLIAATAVGLALVFRVAYPGEGAGFDRRFLSSALCFATGAVLVTFAVRGRVVASCLLACLAAWDAYHFNLSHPDWGWALWKGLPTLEELKAASPLPPEPGAGRVMQCAWHGTQSILLGERLVNGYRGGIEPRKCLNYYQMCTLQVAGAAWYREADVGPAEKIAGLVPYGNGWYCVPDPLPRVRLLGKGIFSGDPGHDLPNLDLVHAALVTRPLDLDDGPAGKATLIEDRPGRLRVETESPGRQLLVVAESHDPGWHATIDGQPAAVERVNGDFLGCVVGPGQHTVELVFAPLCLLWGRVLSGIGMAGACLLLLTSRRTMPDATG